MQRVFFAFVVDIYAQSNLFNLTEVKSSDRLDFSFIGIGAVVSILFFGETAFTASSGNGRWN